MSATVVTSNLLGPNFSHVSSFKQRLVFNLGQINVANCVESYLGALRNLAEVDFFYEMVTLTLIGSAFQIVKEDPELSSMPT